MLTSYNGKAITSDEIGNPLDYMGLTMTWEYGRKLTAISGDGLEVSYAYSADGKRLSKTVNGVTTDFIYSGDTLAGFKRGDDTLMWLYGADGDYLGFTLNGAEYYYVKNMQGDVVAIADENRNIVVIYTYNDYGKLESISGSLADTVGALNPIRYRGYYYDTETGFYYLQSRYYDPQICRFINADSDEILLEEQNSLLQFNLYAYCFNNPVNLNDTDGYSPANIVGGIVGGVAGAALGYLLAKKLGLTGWKKWALISAATIGGAALGAFLGPYVAKWAKSVGSTVKRAAKNVVKYGKELCFVAGTKILTEDGKVPIEKIKVGDYVYAEDPETGEIALKRVAQVFVNETKELVHVVINGEEIITTPGHPFYVSGKGWVGADELACGDKVILYGGQCAYVEKVSIEHLITAVKVYNFEVEDFHTYFVGDNSVLVHNKGCGLNKINEKYLKKLNLDAHKIKKEFLGKRANISHFDLAVDKKTGIIYIIDKAGKIVEKTWYTAK